MEMKMKTNKDLVRIKIIKLIYKLNLQKFKLYTSR